MAEAKAREQGPGGRPAALRVVVAEPPTEALSRLELLTGNVRGLDLAAHVGSANDALSAIKVLPSLRGAAVIVALSLSGPRDAFWLIRSIRERFPSLPILACHIGADEATISRAFFAGADGYVDTTAGSKRFLRALKQVAAGELVLQDSSGPETDDLEEDRDEEAPLAVQEGAADSEDLLEPTSDEPVRPAPARGPGVAGEVAGPRPTIPAAALRTEPLIPTPPEPGPGIPKRPQQEKPRRWFGGRKEQRRHPVKDVPPWPIKGEPPPRPAVPDERRPPSRRETKPEPEPAWDPEQLYPRPPFEPLEEPAEPDASSDAGDAVWAPGTEWEDSEPSAGQPRPAASTPSTSSAFPGLSETVWADEREIAGSTPKAVVQPKLQPPPTPPKPPAPKPVARAEPKAKPKPSKGAPEKPQPEPEATSRAEPKPAATAEPKTKPAPPQAPEPVAPHAPKPVATPEPEPEPDRASVVAVSSEPMFWRDLSQLLGRAPGEVSRLPTVEAAEEFFTDHPDRCSVLIAAPDLTEGEALRVAGAAMRRSPTTAVVLVRQDSSGTLFQAAMRAGVRELVDLSVGGEELLRDAVERAFAWSQGLRSTGREPPAPKPSSEGVLVTVFSSKGGGGKTFVAANLAAAVASKSGQDSAILDLDLETGEVFSYFGRDVPCTPQDLLAVGGRAEPAEVMRAGTPLGAELFGYAARSSVGGGQTVTAEMIGKLLKTLRKTFAYTIVDTSGAYSDHALTALELSDRICLVATQQVAGLRHLERTLDPLNALGLQRERLMFVLNRADGRTEPSDSEIEGVVKLHVDVRIPASTQVPVSQSKGRPVYLEVPSADVSRAIDRLAGQVVALRSPVRK